MGVGCTRRHIHCSREFTTKNHQQLNEYGAHHGIWKSWWNKHKAFANKCDGRTFAQVLKQSNAQTQIGVANNVSHNVSLQNERKKKIVIV